MVDRLSDVNDSADTNFDSSVSISRRYEVECSLLVKELTRQVAQLRQELMQVRQELENV